MAKLTDKEILTYIKDNNLEENLEYGVEKGQDYIAHDLSCSSRKDVYRTYEDARKALKQRHGRRANEKDIYKCSECGYFHFTSKANSNGIKKKGYERRSHRRKNIIRKTTENYGNYGIKYEKIKKMFDRGDFKKKPSDIQNNSKLYYTDDKTVINNELGEKLLNVLNNKENDTKRTDE